MLSVELGVRGQRRSAASRRVRRPAVRPDLIAIAAVAVLVTVGLAHLRGLRANSLAAHQAAAVVVGVLLLLVLRRLRSGQLRRLAWASYGASNLLLAVVG